jgi:tetrapyrrole methylase family protein / MazG family protein
MIDLIGLGPADAGGLSVAARDALRAALHLFVRTARHPAVEALAAEGLAFESFDGLYDSLPTFEAVYDAIAQRLIAEAGNGDVAFAVPGHPLVAEESVRRLVGRARDEGVPFRVIGSASFIEPALAALGLSLTDGLLLMDALSLDAVPPRVDVGLLLYQVYDREAASSAKLALMKAYPDDWPVSVVRHAGEAGAEAVEQVPLHRLDRVASDHLTTVHVPPLPPEKRKKSFSDLVTVMARLRGEGGCPWDREQDHQTLKRYLIEECYETIDAIEADDLDALKEELGDVLLQVVFHAQLEAEVGTFDVDDVIAVIVEKLIRRHPHVFGDLDVADSDEVLRNWEQIKKAEKGEGWRESVLDGVPASLPALMRAMEISKRAVKVGFEWEKVEDVFSKMEEEVGELREAIAGGRAEEVRDEIGDLLFTVVNVARWQEVDPEEALRHMVTRFYTRFRYIEQAAQRQGRDIKDLTLAEMDALWEEAKRG